MSRVARQKKSSFVFVDEVMSTLMVSKAKAYKLLPYFGKKTLVSIKASDVIQWQNELLEKRDKKGNPYSQTYLRTIQNQLSAILNHAQNFYGLTVNPYKQAGKM